MPIKKVTQCISGNNEMKEIKQITLNEIVKYQRANSTSVSNCIIAIIIIAFCITISADVFNNMEEKFTVSDKQAKACMVNFQETGCNPLKLDEKCGNLWDCVQKEETAGIITKSWSFFNFSVAEIKENVIFPCVMIALVILFQIAKVMKKQEEKDENAVQ
jgi:hypothetical protein